MAVRRERVIVDLEDNLTAGLARMAVGATVVDKALDRMGTSAVRSGDGIDRAGSSINKAGPDIDKFSGRLRALLSVATLLGPAISPLGAAAIPLLTGSLVAMGAAAGGIGATVLALSGLGDALDSIDAYQLEPTAENLQAMRLEMEKLGPAGADFARFIDGIEGQLKTLQIAAREGALPGFEEGITSALDRLPEIRSLVSEMSKAVGSLASDAGADLAGGDWQAFFDYLASDGRSTLESFGNAIGDVANGLADMLVAFAPVTRDFSNGFEDMAQSFSDWASTLSESESFQELLVYIQQSGPQAIALLGSLVKTLASLGTAFAPIGAITLPILTKLLDLLGAIASSPLGTPFAAAVVGITAYTTAVSIATAAQARFAAAAATSFAATGPLLAIAALAAGIVGLADAYGKAEEMSARWENELEQGTFKVKDARAEIEAMKDDLDTDRPSEFFSNIVDLDVWAAFTDEALGFKTETQEAEEALWRFIEAGKGTDGILALTADALGVTADQFRVASGEAQAFTGAIAELNGWLDKRQALRDYNASIRDLGRSMRNGFTRADVENLDAIGRNIAQVASQIKDKSVRAAFLDQAQKQLERLAEKGGPRARAEIDKILAKMTELGLFKAEPKVDPDTKKADQKTKKAKDDLAYLDKLTSKPTVDANTAPATSAINRLMAELRGIPDQTVNVNVIRRGVSNAAAQGVGPGAINERRGSRMSAGVFGRGDLDGQNGGKAELFDALLRDGSTSGAAQGVTNSLRRLQAALAKAERAVAREQRARDAIASNMDSIRGGIRNDLGGSLFGVSEGSGNVWAAGATPGGVMDPFAALQARKDRARRMLAAIKTLKRKGVAGAALQEILGEGLEAAEYMAAQSASALGGFAKDYNATASLINQAANAGANAAYGADFSVANAELAQANKKLAAIEKAIKQADKNNKDGHKGTQQSNHGFQSALRRGHRRGKARAN